jgi:hypothetical protein
VRDLAALEALNVPVYAIGVSAIPPGRRGPGRVGLPIVCGGRPVASGDVIVADRDGVAVGPRERIAETLERLERVRLRKLRCSNASAPERSSFPSIRRRRLRRVTSKVRFSRGLGLEHRQVIDFPMIGLRVSYF